MQLDSIFFSIIVCDYYLFSTIYAYTETDLKLYPEEYFNEV